MRLVGPDAGADQQLKQIQTKKNKQKPFLPISLKMFFNIFLQNVFVFSMKKLASMKTCRLPQLSFPPGTCERSRGRAPPEGNSTPKCPQKNSELTKCFQKFRLTTCSKTMSRFPFVFPCNFLYAGSMLYALCNVVDKKQHFYDLCNLCNLCTLRGFAAFCRCLSLSSFLHFFISSLCQNLISETLLRYGALLISPRWGQAPRARPTQSYPFLLHLQRPDVERRKLNLCPVSF